MGSETPQNITVRAVCTLPRRTLCVLSHQNINNINYPPDKSGNSSLCSVCYKKYLILTSTSSDFSPTLMLNPFLCSILQILSPLGVYFRLLSTQLLLQPRAGDVYNTRSAILLFFKVISTLVFSLISIFFPNLSILHGQQSL